MSSKSTSPLNLNPDASELERRVEQLRQQIASIPPQDLADRSGTHYQPSAEGQQGEIRFSFWGQENRLTFPDLALTDAKGRPVPTFLQAHVFYYFLTADGTPLSGHWIAFSEMPDGRFYDAAFQGYTGRELGRAFQNDLELFEKLAEQSGGVRQSTSDRVPGDGAYFFQVLPRLPLLLVYWRGDEDFPASFKILLDASASHYLPTDACAILGSMLTRRILTARTRHKADE